MEVDGITPILNVSSIVDSFTWFGKFGWNVHWAWDDPPTFGAVRIGDISIFLCQNCQGARGGPIPRHVGDDDTGGVWMTWWLKSPEAVDEAHALAVREGCMITMPPEDKPWNVREFHLRHPDGHTFRVSCALPED